MLGNGAVTSRLTRQQCDYQQAERKDFLLHAMHLLLLFRAHTQNCCSQGACTYMWRQGFVQQTVTGSAWQLLEGRGVEGSEPASPHEGRGVEGSDPASPQHACRVAQVPTP